MNTLEVKLNDLHIGILGIEGKDELYQFEYTSEWKQTGYEISPHLNCDNNITSIFEANLQEGLCCSNGFKAVKEILGDEGNVSEVSTLIEVYDAFVQCCADVIRDVSEVTRRVHPEFV